MIEIFKKAKQNKEILFFENFQKPEISWEEMLLFLYKESTIENEVLADRVLGFPNVDACGNIQIQDKFWLAPQTNYLFDKFKGVTELLYRVNGDKENLKCSYYSVNPPNDQHMNLCNCDVVWHSQGIRMSLNNRFVSSHQDPWDILYWQILGTSYWRINEKDVYKLNPGDLLYFSKEDFHAVWCDGPRAGLIIDGIDLLSK